LNKTISIFISALILFSLINIGLAQANTNFVAAVIDIDRTPVVGAKVLLYKDGILQDDYFCYTEDAGFCDVTFNPGLDASTLYSAGTSYPNDPPFDSNWLFFTDTYGNGKVTICPDGFSGICDAIPPEYSNDNGPGSSVYSPTATYNFNITWTDEYSGVNKVILQLDGTNYTVTGSENVYSKTFTGLPAGIYNYTWYANDTANNWASTDAQTFTISKASRTVSLTTDKGWARTYDGTPSSTSCSVSAGGNDGSMIFTMNSSSISTSDLRTNAGTYQYACQWIGGANYSDSNQEKNNLTISKASSTCSLTGISNHVYGTTDTVSCSCTGDGTIHLYRDGILHDEWNNVPIKYGAGTYNWVCNITEGNNYNSASKSQPQIISQATPVLLASVTSPINYSTASDYSASESNAGDDDCTYILLRNGTQIASGSPVADSTVLAAGSYNYTYYTAGCSNYSSAKIEKILIINKANAQVDLSLNGNEGNITVERGSSVNIRADLIEGDSEMELYENETYLANGPTPLTVTKPYGTSGTYKITVIYPETQNYTSYSTYHFIEVVDMTPPIITILSPQTQTYYATSVLLTFRINEPTSWIAYSLDGKTNKTITGNMTLTGLSYGPHNIILYANDTSGNMGFSKVYFTVKQGGGGNLCAIRGICILTY
jgi:hypothetical protein